MGSTSNVPGKMRGRRSCWDVKLADCHRLRLPANQLKPAFVLKQVEDFSLSRSKPWPDTELNRVASGEIGTRARRGAAAEQCQSGDLWKILSSASEWFDSVAQTNQNKS